MKEEQLTGRVTSPCRILIVDDCLHCRQTLGVLLSLMGFQVDEAPDGQTGIDKALAIRPQVVLLEVSLPDMNSFEVAKRLRIGLGRTVRIVALGRSNEVAGAADLFDGCLSEPIDPTELVKLAP